MSDIKEAIRMRLHDDITNKRMIDVGDLANKLHAEYPHIDLHELGEYIFEHIISVGGNAQWGKQ